MPAPVLVLTLALPAVLLLASLYRLDRARRREALSRWAAGGGYRLIAFRHPLMTEATPFPLPASKGQHVVRVEVEDREGVRRSGWVRLGSPWRGLASRRADVRWAAA